jgi:hypothetical protein
MSAWTHCDILNCENIVLAVGDSRDNVPFGWGYIVLDYRKINLCPEHIAVAAGALPPLS